MHKNIVAIMRLFLNIHYIFNAIAFL